MTHAEFISITSQLRKMSQMTEKLPFVYIEDELGLIFIDERGVFNFADRFYNWIESPLRLSDICNLRFSTWYDGDPDFQVEPDNSYIWIHFSTGSTIFLDCQNDLPILRIYVTLYTDSMDRSMCENLKNNCDNVGNDLYVELR